MVIKNMHLFAEEVIPHFREPDGKPTWAKTEPAMPYTYTEQAAQIGKPALRPKARIDGDEYLDSLTGHIPEVIDELKSLRT